MSTFEQMYTLCRFLLMGSRVFVLECAAQVPISIYLSTYMYNICMKYIDIYTFK